jgi:hypothetical protein
VTLSERHVAVRRPARGGLLPVSHRRVCSDRDITIRDGAGGFVHCHRSPQHAGGQYRVCRAGRDAKHLHRGPRPGSEDGGVSGFPPVCFATVRPFGTRLATRPRLPNTRLGHRDLQPSRAPGRVASRSGNAGHRAEFSITAGSTGLMLRGIFAPSHRLQICGDRSTPPRGLFLSSFFIKDPFRSGCAAEPFFAAYDGAWRPSPGSKPAVQCLLANAELGTKLVLVVIVSEDRLARPATLLFRMEFQYHARPHLDN